MAESKRQNYLHGAAILAVSTVIIKIIGFFYKFPLYNMLGDEGTAYFNVAYSIYNVLLTLSSAGLPVALSRMIAEANTLGRPMQIKKTFRVAMATFVVLGVIGSLILLLFSTELADFMGEVEASQSIWALAPAVFLFCILSAYRGYAQGHSNMVPTSVSQVVETAAKAAFGLAAAWLLLRQDKSLPIVSAGATLSASFGAAVACVYIILNKLRTDGNKQKPLAAPDVSESSSVIFKRLIRIGVPIALGSSVMSIFGMLDTSIINNTLKGAAGFADREATILFGVYTKATSFSNLPPSFITSSFAISIVPAISACIARRNHGEAAAIASSSLRISTLVTLPMCIGISVLAHPIMNVIYPDSAAAGPDLVMVLGVASYFLCMALMTNAILQASGNERLTVVSMVVGGIVKIVVNRVLVGIPSINIMGAPIGTLCCYVVMCGMNAAFLRRGLREKINFVKVLAKPALSSVVMGAAAWAVYGIASRALAGGGGELGRMPMALAMFAAIAAGVIVYLTLIIVTRAVTLEDMKLIPKGEKLAKILRIK